MRHSICQVSPSEVFISTGLGESWSKMCGVGQHPKLLSRLASCSVGTCKSNMSYSLTGCAKFCQGCVFLRASGSCRQGCQKSHRQKTSTRRSLLSKSPSEVRFTGGDCTIIEQVRRSAKVFALSSISCALWSLRSRRRHIWNLVHVESFRISCFRNGFRELDSQFSGFIMAPACLADRPVELQPAQLRPRANQSEYGYMYSVLANAV